MPSSTLPVGPGGQFLATSFQNIFPGAHAKEGQVFRPIHPEWTRAAAEAGAEHAGEGGREHLCMPTLEASWPLAPESPRPA